MPRRLRSVLPFVEVEMAPVFGVAQHFAGFGKHSLRDRGRRFYRAFLGKEIALFPIFPRFERLAIDVGWEAHAEALIHVQPDDHHLGPAGEIRAVFPERAVGRVVLRADFERLNRGCSWSLERAMIDNYSARPRRIPIS